MKHVLEEGSSLRRQMAAPVHFLRALNVISLGIVAFVHVTETHAGLVWRNGLWHLDNTATDGSNNVIAPSDACNEPTFLLFRFFFVMFISKSKRSNFSDHARNESKQI